MGKIRLAVLAAVLGALALFYCTVMLADLVAGRWWPGFWGFVATFAAAGGCYQALGQYVKVTSKSRGGTHGNRRLRPLAAQPAGTHGLQELCGAAAHARSGADARSPRGSVPRRPPGQAARSPRPAAGPRSTGEVSMVEPLVHNPDGTVEPGPDESW